jgi:hypothetical protein
LSSEGIGISNAILSPVSPERNPQQPSAYLGGGDVAHRHHAFDCMGAKAFGMRTAFIDRRKRPYGETPHQPDMIVGNFAELADALVD